MIASEQITEVTNEYIKQCNENNKTPTFKGVAELLNISSGTVRHIVVGYYKNGKPYTDKPHPLRCVDNDDFRIIQDMFI